MKVAIEVYVAIFIIFLCILLCIGVLEAGITASNARDAYTTYVLQLQNSNYDDAVVDAIKKDAADRGYEINIKVFTDDQGGRSGSVELQYEYHIPIINYTTYKYIRGYAT